MPDKRKILRNALLTAVILAVATLCALGVDRLGIGKESIIMFFLLGVLFATVLTGSYLCGVLTSLLSLMLFNYLFTAPRFTFVIASSGDVVLLAFFLVTAMVSGTVTSRLQQQMELAGQNERAARTLYRIAAGFLSASGKENILDRGVEFVRNSAGAEGAVRLDGEPPRGMLPKERSADYPIVTPGGRLGTLTCGPTAGPQGELVVQAVATQLGIALDREYLYNERERIRVAMERERQRSTLLRSVAHDLRSPLTALSGESNLLADGYDGLSDGERRELARDMSEEIIWLTDLVENILSMTRITESRLDLRRQDEVLDDLISGAVSHVERLMGDRKLTVSLPEEVVCLPVDGKLVVQAIVNLLENAAQHTPPGTPVSLRAAAENGSAVITVADEGPGIDPAVRGRLFERFVTADNAVADGQRGLGLGLAICRAIAEAHGGTVAVSDNRPHGACFTLTLPLQDAPPKGDAHGDQMENPDR